MTEHVVVINLRVVGVDEVGGWEDEVVLDSPGPRNKMIDCWSRVRHVCWVCSKLGAVECSGGLFDCEYELEGVIGLSVDDGVEKPRWW